VEASEGGSRVNGDLAVSRAFGDREYKKTGGPGPEDHPVTADPEMGRFECDEADFILLVCDGVSEGDFPNADVVKLVAEQLRGDGSIGAAARAVCHKAIEKGSKDNITCMIVLLTGTEDDQEEVEFTPGPLTSLSHKGFKTAYAAMAERAGLSLAQAVQRRYDLVQEQLAAAPTEALREEAAKIGRPAGAEGSSERTEWFEAWVRDLPEDPDEGGPGGMDLSSLMGGKGKGGGKGGMPGKGGGREPDVDQEVERTEDGYTWSQRGEEVQIYFQLAKAAAKKDVKVTFKQKALQVAAHGDTLLDGSLGGPVEVDECTWCLSGGGIELQVMLTKKDAKDQWKDLVK